MFFVTYSNLMTFTQKLMFLTLIKLMRLILTFLSTNSQNLINYLETIENIVIKEIIYDDSNQKNKVCWKS